MSEADRQREERRRAARAAARRRRRILFAALALGAVAAGAGAGLAVSRGHADTAASAPPTTTHATTTAARSVATRTRPVSVAVTRAATTTTAKNMPPPPRPRIVWKPVPFDATRRAEMAAYERRHYGRDTWRLDKPKVIVEHYTANDSFSSTWNTFASNAPDGELGELPGTCAHFVVDTEGTIYQLVALTTACRHTVGLNWTAIGIEHVGTSDGAILSNPRQLNASLALTAWLMATYHVQLRNVIGHSESVTSPYHHELYAPWRCQTHGDWSAADMLTYRSHLRLVALRYGIPLGPAAVPARSGC